MRLFLKVTNKCNFHCGYCYYNTDYLHAPVIEEPTLESLKQRMFLSHEMGADSVSFTGGEPFLRSSVLFELIDYADALQMKSIVVTNGSYFMKPVDKALEEVINKVSCMAISMHIDIDTDIERYFSDMKRAITENLCFFLNRIRFNLTLTKSNAAQVRKCVSFAESLGIDINIQPVVINKNAILYSNYSLALLNGDEISDTCDQIMLWATKSHNEIYGRKLCSQLYANITKYNECLAGKSFFVVLENGHVLPCFYREDCDFGLLSDDSRDTIHRKLCAFYSECKKCANEQCITMTEFGQYF